MKCARVLLAVLICLGLVVGCTEKSGVEEVEPVASRPPPKAQQTYCLSNLKQLVLGILMYAQDHDSYLPPAIQWTDCIMPYIRDEATLCCPAAPELEYGYAFNSDLSKVSLKQIPNPADIVVLFESNLGTRNASGGPERIADLPRHNGGNNYAHVDGHCKWYRTPPAFTW